MDDLIILIGKGILRIVGYIFAEIFFSTVCYWVGWPICKLMTLGNYPSSSKAIHIEFYGNSNKDNWCCAVGLIFIFIIFILLII